MKAIYLIIFISSSLLFSMASCTTSSSSISNMEAKIIGTWEFDQVKFKPNNKGWYSDYSKGYQGCTVTFKEGGILEAYDKDLDTIASGVWYIDYYIDYDTDNDGNQTSDRVYFMVGNLDIPELNIFEDLLWDELTISNKRLKAIEEDKDDGKYKYELVR